MAPATNAQRMEQMELEIFELPSKIAQEVAAAMAALRTDPMSQMAEGFEQNAIQMRAELSALSSRMDGKIANLREERRATVGGTHRH